MNAEINGLNIMIRSIRQTHDQEAKSCLVVRNTGERAFVIEGGGINIVRPLATSATPQTVAEHERQLGQMLNKLGPLSPSNPGCVERSILKGIKAGNGLEQNPCQRKALPQRHPMCREELNLRYANTTYALIQGARSDTLVKLLRQYILGTTVVFVNTPNSAHVLHHILNRRGFKSTLLIEGMTSLKEKCVNLEALHNGFYPLLIAHNKQAEVLDCAYIHRVINFDMPNQNCAGVYKSRFECLSKYGEMATLVQSPREMKILHETHSAILGSQRLNQIG